jgi:aspartate kinase
MALRVLKFGGTSVESPTRILAVARRILRYRDAGHAVVVVVSAMGQTTDELIRLAERVSRSPKRRELDMLLTAGERISMALLAMALESLGCPAISFTGSQSGIVTDSRHADARIRTIRPRRIEEELGHGKVVIVAGFQGVSAEKEITTLGRGGSDTTAVALALCFGAERCEIFTDVPGVYSADPRVVPGARPLQELDYEPMIVLSHLGGRVLFRRAVLLARKYALAVEVRSSLTEDPGTLIPRPERAPERIAFTEEESGMESERILGVALESPVTWGRVTRPAHRGPHGAAPPGAPGDAGAGGEPSVLWYSQTELPGGSELVQWIVLPEPTADAWNEAGRWGPEARVQVEREGALVSLVGEGILADGALLARARRSLDDAGIEVWASFAASLALSFLVPEAAGEEATRRLHQDLVESRPAP